MKETKFIKPCWYCEVYDAKYNKRGKWLERVCHNKSCEFCAKRPRKHPKDCKCPKDTSNYIIKWKIKLRNLFIKRVKYENEKTVF